MFFNHYSMDTGRKEVCKSHDKALFFSSSGTGQLRLVVCVSAPCSVLTRKGFNSVRRALSFLAGLGFVYSPAIISIAPSIFQPLQVNSLSVLIMPRTERRAWGWWGSGCVGKREKQKRKAFEWREKECLLCWECCLELGARAFTESKRAPLCVVSTPPPANLQWG